MTIRMLPHDTHIAERLRALVGEVRELRRWYRHAVTWDEQRAMVQEVLNGFNTIVTSDWLRSHVDSMTLTRLRANIMAGRDLLVTTPNVLAGYLDGAAAELEGMAERIERGGGKGHE